MRRINHARKGICNGPLKKGISMLLTVMLIVGMGMSGLMARSSLAVSGEALEIRKDNFASTDPDELFTFNVKFATDYPSAFDPMPLNAGVDLYITADGVTPWTPYSTWLSANSLAPPDLANGEIILRDKMTLRIEGLNGSIGYQVEEVGASGLYDVDSIICPGWKPANDAAGIYCPEDETGCLETHIPYFGETSAAFTIDTGNTARICFHNYLHEFSAELEFNKTVLVVGGGRAPAANFEFDVMYQGDNFVNAYASSPVVGATDGADNYRITIGFFCLEPFSDYSFEIMETSIAGSDVEMGELGWTNSGPISVTFSTTRNDIDPDTILWYGGDTVYNTFTDPEESEPPLTGDLKVSKLLFGDDTDSSKDFTFKVVFSDGETYGGVASGGTFTLKGGQSKTITGITQGVTYTVTETDANTDGYTTSSTGESGTISGTLSEAVFTNTKNAAAPLTGDLKVSKLLVGNNTDSGKDFTFKVVFGDGETYDGVASGATFTLKGGQSKTITGIPQGVTYTVTETDANTDGYTTSSTGESGTVSGTLSEAVFTNTKNRDIITQGRDPDPDPDPTPDPKPVTDPKPTPDPDPDPRPKPDPEPPHIPGGTDRYVKPKPNTPGREMIPDGDGWIELDEDDVPLGRWDWDHEGGTWAFAEYPILSAMPQTGITDVIPLLFDLLMFSMIGMGLTMRAIKRKRAEQEK